LFKFTAKKDSKSPKEADVRVYYILYCDYTFRYISLIVRSVI